jgi:peptidoglycan/xylan/chitin deacetylase (PgdA/CDA1 family)
MRHAYPVQAQLEEMERNEALIRSISGQSGLSVYRPPVGLKSPNFARAAHRLSLNVIAWSVHSRDTLDSNGPRIARRILSRIRGGDIVLLHDGHQRPGAQRTSALGALPSLLAGLKARNLEPVTVSELLA